MPTMSSDDVFMKALYFKQLVSEMLIKHYEQKRFAEIVEEIFADVFKDYND